jgi:hypothetical protein
MPSSSDLPLETCLHISLLGKDVGCGHFRVGNQDLFFQRGTCLLKRQTFWLEYPMEYKTTPNVRFCTNTYGLGKQIIFNPNSPRRQTFMMGNTVCFILEYDFKKGVLTLMRGSSIKLPK